MINRNNELSINQAKNIMLPHDIVVFRFVKDL